MSNATQDSTKLLAEKLSLSRELAVLKPELDHLRSQLLNQQTTLAEKLELERQVTTLEVELANEKKATKRAMQSRESNDRVEDDLRKRLRETEKQVTAEKAQRERLEDQLAQEKQTRQLVSEEQDSTRELESELRKKLQDAQRELRGEREEKERLEEELQAEQRVVKKAQKKQLIEECSEDELLAKVEELERKLASEKKATEKIRIEAQTSLDETESRREAWEKKFEKLKVKYRELQDELKQCRASLRKAEQKAQQIPVEELSYKATGRQALKKRKAHELANDDFTHISIATPGADDRVAPRRGLKKIIEPAVVGEKSAFSVTPFLNKTLEVGDDTSKPNNDDDDNDEMDDTFAESHPTTRVVEVTTTSVPLADAEADADDEPTSPSEATTTTAVETEKSKAQPKSRGRPKKVLSDAPSAKKNALPKTAPKKGPKAAATRLENVPEEKDSSGDKEKENVSEASDKRQVPLFDLALPQDESKASAAGVPKEAEPKKKKRKMLGATKTLFDEEEDKTPAPVRKTDKAVHLGGHKRAALGGVRNALAAKSFSPLKRDRRGVAASFLA
jgi:hypothetical protein